MGPETQIKTVRSPIREAAFFGAPLLATLGALLLGAQACGEPDTVLTGDGGANDNRDGGNSDEDGGNDASGCKKIDLVFSVDPSGSMEEELMAMSTDVFPKFATALRTVGDGLEDSRVAVLDACPNAANYHTGGLGQADCGFQSGQVWIDSSSTALEAEFSCVGDILPPTTCQGDNEDEQPIAAAVASLSAPFSTNENAGFLRDDALLVVVTITDEDECSDFPGCNDTSDARAMALYNSLVATKGDVRKMVYLGIGGGLGPGTPEDCPSGTYGSADGAILTNKVANLFIASDRGVAWDLCVGQLEDGLTAAMAVIESACDDFPPID